MPHAYSEDPLLEQPAIGLFAELGWTTVSVLEEVFGATGTFKRQTSGNVVLLSRLRSPSECLNAELPNQAKTATIRHLVLNRRQKSSARAQLKLTIEDVLDSGLPRAYDKPLYELKCSALFEHIYESYPEREANPYQGVA